ncbi:MAG TPA: tetratricopeptide repeat protein [Vicinamibacterales bacterium]|nr:tetratricopeptide repeat protein [Vicinamibacterales bacterium]
MNKQAIAIGIAGVLFGVLVGWIIGSQQSAPASATSAAAASAQPANGQASAQPTATPLDETRAAALASTAQRNPNDEATRVQLANMYFDAERYQEATNWYQQALAINPRDVNASTDLGIAYYYMNEPDRALAQFDKSLSIDPKHAKTLLNVGIVRAFAKQDLRGAAEAWQRALDAAPPGSPEAKAAQQALEGVKAAHPEINPSSGKGTPD